MTRRPMRVQRVDLLSLAHEVSERIKSEAELHATRERHRAFIQASLDSIWAVDVEPPIPTSLPPQSRSRCCVSAG